MENTIGGALAEYNGVGLGFDAIGRVLATAGGLLDPKDYRDLPYQWKSGFFAIDFTRLRTRFKPAKLVLGDVSKTTTSFVTNFSPAPIGVFSHDLDFYSSTAAALRLFDVENTPVLTQMFCYFDDTVGNDTSLYKGYTVKRMTIHEFNKTHETVKLSPAHYLRLFDNGEIWKHQIWIQHFFLTPITTDLSVMSLNSFRSEPGRRDPTEAGA